MADSRSNVQGLMSNVDELKKSYSAINTDVTDMKSQIEAMVSVQ